MENSIFLIYGVQWKVRYLITSLQTDSPVTIAGLIMHSQSWTSCCLLLEMIEMAHWRVEWYYLDGANLTTLKFLLIYFSFRGERKSHSELEFLTKCSCQNAERKKIKTISQLSNF